MKKALRFITPIIMVVLIAACGSENSESKAENLGSTEETQAQTDQDNGNVDGIEKDNDQEVSERNDAEPGKVDDTG